MLSSMSARKLSSPVTADINLRRRTVHLLVLEKTERRGAYLEHIFEPLEDPSGISAQALEKPLTAAVQAAGKRADSDGFTFNEIRTLVEQAVLPGRKHFEKLEKLLEAPLLPEAL